MRMPHQDQPISALGREQAVRFAKYLRRRNITEVYVSGYIRTMQTTRPFARRARLRPFVDTAGSMRSTWAFWTQ